MTENSIKQNEGVLRTDDGPRAVDLDAGRRAFMRTVGLGTAGAAMLGATGPAAAQTAPARIIGDRGRAAARAAERAEADANIDADVLNFALNLEYLEAEFYLRAAFGRGLADGDISGGDFMGRDQLGPVRGGRRVPFTTPTIRQYAEELANDEERHVKLLRRALGEARVPRPTIDIGGAFTNLARAAGLVGQNQDFDPYANENNFLLASFVFEDVGVTAYQGGAPLLTDKGVLAAAAGLLAVEAYHAATIRTVLTNRGLFEQTERISNLRDNLDGEGDTDQGIGTPDRVNITPTDDNALTFARTTRQVLNIVYFRQGASSGGFFPDSLNGNIQ